MCISSNSNLIFPCKICNTNTKDTDSAAECDIYQFWIHMICNNLNHNSISLVLKPSTNLSLLTVCFYHVTYAFQSESTLYSCLNVKELLARSRREI